MADGGIEVRQVWKKFAGGETFDSLRDLLPSLARRIFDPSRRTELQNKEFWALRDVSFSVRPGEALGIIGPNGSGKSTMLKLLSRILRPTRGTIGVRGRLGALIELGAGFHPDLTGRENIYLNGTILGMKRREIDAKFDSIVEFSGLPAFLDMPVKRYSSGMYARLGFSVAAHVDPDVLVVDEVLSVGDYHFQQRCYDKMKDFVRRGTSVVFVSHNMTAVRNLCGSALLLNKGETAYHGHVSGAIQCYHSLHEQSLRSEDAEVVEVTLRNAAGQVTEAFDPGEKVTLHVKLKALRPIANAHAAVLIHTTEGELIFDTATSRLIGQSLTLQKDQVATIMFTLDMNLHCGVYLLGFTVTSEIEVAGQFIYYNGCLKRVVMGGQRQSNGILYLNPRAQLTLS